MVLIHTEFTVEVTRIYSEGYSANATVKIHIQGEITNLV